MKHEGDTSNMSCNLKYSVLIAKRVAYMLVQTTDTFLRCTYELYIHKSSRSWS